MPFREALYTVQFGNSELPATLLNGGVAVFETGRGFGGDSAFYYVGRYTASDGRVRCTARIKKYASGSVIDAFFGGESDFEVEAVFNAVDERKLVGLMWRVGHEDAKVGVVLTWVDDLP